MHRGLYSLLSVGVGLFCVLCTSLALSSFRPLIYSLHGATTTATTDAGGSSAIADQLVFKVDAPRHAPKLSIAALVVGNIKTHKARNRMEAAGDDVDFEPSLRKMSKKEGDAAAKRTTSTKTSATTTTTTTTTVSTLTLNSSVDYVIPLSHRIDFNTFLTNEEKRFLAQRRNESTTTMTTTTTTTTTTPFIPLRSESLWSSETSSFEALLNQQSPARYDPVLGLTKSRTLTSDEVRRVERLLATPTMRRRLPSHDEFADVRRHWRHCAVVGNSGILRNSSLGSEIDSHDMIMRFNWPPLRGYEVDVGSRTHLMLVNRKNLLRSHWPPQVSFASYPTNVAVISMLYFLDEFHFWLQWSQFEPTRRLRILSSSFRANCTEELRQRFAAVAHRRPESVQASSGMIGVMLALTSCETIDIYGFGTSVYSGNGHYYAPHAGVVQEWKIHDFDVEQQLFRELELQNYAPLFLPARVTPASVKFHRDAQSKGMIDRLLRQAKLRGIDTVPNPKRAQEEAAAAAAAVAAAAAAAAASDVGGNFNNINAGDGNGDGDVDDANSRVASADAFAARLHRQSNDAEHKRMAHEQRFKNRGGIFH